MIAFKPPASSFVPMASLASAMPIEAAAPIAPVRPGGHADVSACLLAPQIRGQFRILPGLSVQLAPPSVPKFDRIGQID